MGGKGRIPIEWPVRSLGTCAEAVLRRVGHRRYRGVRCAVLSSILNKMAFEVADRVA